MQLPQTSYTHNLLIHAAVTFASAALAYGAVTVGLYGVAALLVAMIAMSQHVYNALNDATAEHNARQRAETRRHDQALIDAHVAARLAQSRRGQ